MTRLVEDERITVLRDDDPRTEGRYVLYWMQASQRAEHNPALEYAIRRANAAEVPVVVLAVVVPDYPEASARHFAFLLGGLGRALGAIERRGGRPVLRVGDPIAIVGDLAVDATEVVLDRGYLRHQQEWYRRLTDDLDVRLTQLEGDVVVPVDLVSDDAEHSARTIRPKINDVRDRFLVALDPTPIDVTTTPQGTTSELDIDRLVDHDAVVDVVTELGVPAEPGPLDEPVPGTAAARSRLDDLLDRLATYDDDRNRFDDDESSSSLSPYLHFGQISPVAVALAAIERAGDDAEPFLEELVVRRELAINFVARTSNYDSYSSLPDWSRTTLDDHVDDERAHVYTASELERGATHDEVWNVIMRVIRERGWVHNQLRMYWGKQVVRWTNTPQHAHRTLLELNNRYFLDGRDPNSFANVGWVFGLHDRAFQERDVSGKLRPFTTAALKRKGDLEAWVARHRSGSD